jgi:hypothetical protein
MGISPWRTQAWSQARIPGEARMTLHLLTSCSALVIPVTDQAPICAWSPWTLKQVHGCSESGIEYTPDRQYEELFGFLETVISVKDVDEIVRENYRHSMGVGLQSVIQGVVNTKDLGKEVLGKVDLGRAGIVLFRY